MRIALSRQQSLLYFPFRVLRAFVVRYPFPVAVTNRSYKTLGVLCVSVVL